MPTLLRHIVQPFAMLLIALPAARLQAGDHRSPIVGAGGDNAVTRVLASGYTLSPQGSDEETGAGFLGVNPTMDPAFDPGRSWRLALDLSRSDQVADDISFALGNKAMRLPPPFDAQEGQLFSVLFNMPNSYKNHLTIPPALQWSRPLSGSFAETSAARSDASSEKSTKDVFYGGVSVSFPS